MADWRPLTRQKANDLPQPVAAPISVHHEVVDRTSATGRLEALPRPSAGAHFRTTLPAAPQQTGNSFRPSQTVSPETASVDSGRFGDTAAVAPVSSSASGIPLGRSTAAAPRSEIRFPGRPAAAVHAKLVVNQPNDPEEQAADDAARAVGRGAAVAQQSPSTLPAAADPDLVGRLGPSFSMPGPLRGPLEHAFHRDLGNVQLHTGAQAERAAAGLNARAFAVGEHIAFGSRAFSPETQSGLELAAHEAAHVVAVSPGIHRALIGYVALQNPPGSDLRRAAVLGYGFAPYETDRAEFRTKFLAELQDFVDEYYP